jgi:regulator of replication initiation timing
MEQMVKEIEQQVKMRMESAIKAEIEEKTKAIKEENFQIKAKQINMAEENKTLKTEITKLKEDIEAYKAGNIKYSLENTKLKEKLEAFTRMETMIAKYANPALANKPVAFRATTPAPAPAPAPAENIILVVNSDGTKKQDPKKRLGLSPYLNQPVKTRPKLKGNINFTDDEVREIRRQWALPYATRPSPSEMAETWGADKSTVRKIGIKEAYMWVK